LEASNFASVRAKDVVVFVMDKNEGDGFKLYKLFLEESNVFQLLGRSPGSRGVLISAGEEPKLQYLSLLQVRMNLESTTSHAPNAYAVNASPPANLNAL
jgi:hypothetical protein